MLSATTMLDAAPARYRVVVLTLVLMGSMMFASEIPWVAEIPDVYVLLLGLLAAQAAFTALTFSVALLMLQAFIQRHDVDAHLSRKYESRLRVLGTLGSSTAAVLNSDPEKFAEDSDPLVRLRESRQWVEYEASECVGFCVADPHRARRLVQPRAAVRLGLVPS